MVLAIYYEISCTEMEKMIRAMTSGPGVIGARQAGAGFGGCMVAFVRKAEVEKFSQHIWAHYYASTGIEPRVSGWRRPQARGYWIIAHHDREASTARFSSGVNVCFTKSPN
ncbi:MAG: hypothetical protein JXA78_00755 [Anaerolineales bacterium]|nr:hypothetical protein [Anaerolineales bacterium]